MKRLDNLVNDILTRIVDRVLDERPESNVVHEIDFEFGNIYGMLNYNVSVGYDLAFDLIGCNDYLAIDSITLNSAFVTSISARLQEDLPNVKELLNEKLAKYELKDLDINL